ncbi:uncharacterized protein N7511_001375 [Penicillium nucicola]|uniref:uncharacterized protein n=1 Tax=Penicillium nucicola TaxID=1850975 RepID=UPI00254579A6|nr:uncharacterized protein N7511_001375 [Penicillium nucicola]KAJ5776364.1 hypothetical protein N7511_001375 [Penicillium nucicola]
MKLIEISVLLCALNVAALPRDMDRPLVEQCSNNQLSCCSNLKNTANANIDNVDQTMDIGNPVAVLGAVSVLVGNTLSQAVEALPISILSGCAPLIAASKTGV